MILILQQALSQIESALSADSLNNVYLSNVIPALLIALTWVSIPIAARVQTSQQKEIRKAGLYKATTSFACIGAVAWLITAFLEIYFDSDLITATNRWMLVIAHVGGTVAYFPIIMNAFISTHNKVAELKSELVTTRIKTSKIEEALAQANRMGAVGQLTGGVAHDFNNLLQGISGNLELIESFPDNPLVPSWAAGGMRSVDRAASLTAKLRDFSRIPTMEKRPVDVRALIYDMHSMLSTYLGRIPAIIEAERYVVVLTDAVQLELAILNLVINARDAMTDESGCIVLRTRLTQWEGAEFVEIVVKDTGSGIPADKVEQVFDPFFTTKAAGKGTGFGLSMVASLAKQSGGRAYVEQTSSKGTTIVIALPVSASEPMRETGVRLQVNRPRCGNGLTVMLIEEEDSVREVFGSHLRMMGYLVKDAVDGVDALVQLKAGARPDLMLISLPLRLICGLEVARAAKIMIPDIKVAYLSSVVLEGPVEHPIIQKPFPLESLDTLVSSLLPAEHR